VAYGLSIGTKLLLSVADLIVTDNTSKHNNYWLAGKIYYCASLLSSQGKRERRECVAAWHKSVVHLL